MIQNVDRNAERIANLQTIEYDFHALRMVAGILANMLDEALARPAGEPAPYRDVRIGEDEMGHLSYLWNDVQIRSARLEDAFMEAMYPKKDWQP